MAETSDFQGTVKIRAKSEEVVAKIIALNSVAQLNTYYDTQFQDFETIRHSSPDEALKDTMSKLTFEKTPEGVECKDLKIYGNGRYSMVFRNPIRLRCKNSGIQSYAGQYQR